MWDFCARGGQDPGLQEEWDPPPVATRALCWALGGRSVDRLEDWLRAREQGQLAGAGTEGGRRRWSALSVDEVRCLCPPWGRMPGLNTFGKSALARE
eukprot:9844230-Alexandrium_andersonii.AAC.1